MKKRTRRKFILLIKPTTSLAWKDTTNLPKKGMVRPTINVDITNAVLIRIEYIRDLASFDGNNSSRLIATGDKVNAYVFIIKEEAITLFFCDVHAFYENQWKGKELHKGIYENFKPEQVNENRYVDEQ